jgi:broad specificity phosphatase PhoE
MDPTIPTDDGFLKPPAGAGAEIEAGTPVPRLVLVKHAMPVLDPSRPAREWLLGEDGEAQARELADRLRAFAPLRLITSPEPKAVRTCEIVAGALGVPMREVDALREIDRRRLPLMSSEEHQRNNAGIFAHRDRPVLGTESARDALARFRRGVLAEVDALEAGNLVVVSHGTVISLLVAEYHDVDAFTIWKSLRCATFLAMPLHSLIGGPG